MSAELCTDTCPMWVCEYGCYDIVAQRYHMILWYEDIVQAIFIFF